MHMHRWLFYGTTLSPKQPQQCICILSMLGQILQPPTRNRSRRQPRQPRQPRQTAKSDDADRASGPPFRA